MLTAKHQKLILIDFDHTLFNTTRFVQRLKEVFQSRGVSEQEFQEKRMALKDCCHLDDIDTFVDKFSYPDKKDLHDLIHTVIVNEAHTFIFDDVRSFFEEHATEFDIIILTQGDKEMQAEKVEHSNLIYDVPLIITGGEKEIAIRDVVTQYKKIYFIDDKAVNIDRMKKAYPQIETYFLKREDDRPYADLPSTCGCADHVIADLREKLL